MRRDFPFENGVVLDLVAALGAISKNVKSVSVTCWGGTVTIYFSFYHERDQNQEYIEDVLSEYSALQDDPTDSPVVVARSVVDNIHPYSEIEHGERIVYLREEVTGTE